MTRRISTWIRAAAWAAPAALFASAWTDGDRPPIAPCPPVVDFDPDAPSIATRGVAQQWSIGDPTAEEQLLLEYMNRARLHPGDEGDRILVDYGSTNVKNAVDYFLKQRPGVEYTRAENQTAFHGYPTKPPFAFSSQLVDAARGHGSLMIQYDQQSHQVVNGSGQPVEPTLRDRASAAGYSGNPLGESVFAYAPDMLSAHASFAIDYGQPTQESVNGVLTNCFPDGRPCLGHRLSLMAFDDDPGYDYREVGVGVLADSNPTTQVGPRVVTIDFGKSTNGPTAFVTGVVYDDKNGDGFYDVGEGIGGVRIDLDVGTTYAVTSSSGGYAIPVYGSPGAVHVTATGQTGTPGEAIGTQTVAVDVADQNVKVDFNRPPDPTLPPFVEFDSTGPTPFDDSGPALSSIVATTQAGFPSTLGDVQVEVAIDHPAREEFKLTLVAPDATEVVLFDHGPAGANLNGVFDASLASREPLDPLIGGNYVGTWSLRLEDTVAGNSGTLKNWKLHLRPRWVRTLHSHASPLFVTKLATKNTKKAAGDSIVFQALVDVGGASLGAPGNAVLRLRAADATHAELFSTPLPATSIQRAVNGTSKTVVKASVKGLDLPATPLPATVEIELTLDDAVLRQTVPLVKGAFNGATTKCASDAFHVDSLTAKVVAGVPNYTVKGRVATASGPIVGAGTLEVSLGAVRFKDSMTATKRKGATTTYKGASTLRSLTVDPVKGAFTMVVATSADLLAGAPTLGVSLRLGDDGCFGSTSIKPAGSGSSTKY